MDIGFVIVCVVLFLGSRDALQKYYRRAGELLTLSQRKGVRIMANGGGPDHHDDRKTVERKEPKSAAGKHERDRSEEAGGSEVTA